jgi:lipopolysaccharide transport protein LptA
LRAVPRRILRVGLWTLALIAGFAAVLFVVFTGGEVEVRRTAGVEQSSRIEGFTFEDLVGNEKRLTVAAGLGTFDEEGNFTVQDVRRVEISRDGKPPLVARAHRGAGSGPQGQRIIRLEGGVEVFDQEAGVRASLPSLEIDQAAGLARSLGEVRVDGGTMRGRADAVIYGLESHPTELFVLQLEGADGSSLEAGHAVVGNGERRLELTGAVKVTEGGATLRSQRVVVYRTEEGRPQRAEISLGLTILATFADRPDLHGKAQAGHVIWDEGGELSAVLLEGDAHVAQAATSLDGERIRASRISPQSGWDFDANGNVRARGLTRQGNAVLEADRLLARTGPSGNLMEAEAIGAVAFRSDEAVADSDRARFRPEETQFPVILEATAGGRVRVASGRTRIAASTIRTDAEGTKMAASGRVEASLLPSGSEERRGRAPGPFQSDEAVHFVSRELQTRDGGAALSFRGEVRGWQGERHLSAERVDLEEARESLLATGNVLSRFPDPARPEEGSAFLQVAADRLDYVGENGTAVYDGNVRVRQLEGWLEADRLEIDLGGDERREIEEIRGAGDVRFEYRAGGNTADTTPARGSADRMRYIPDARVVRLMGDRAPAEIRRPGDKGGSTRGRVLRYELDTGTVDVESSVAGSFP